MIKSFDHPYLTHSHPLRLFRSCTHIVRLGGCNAVIEIVYDRSPISGNVYTNIFNRAQYSPLTTHSPSVIHSLSAKMIVFQSHWSVDADKHNYRNSPLGCIEFRSGGCTYAPTVYTIRHF